MPLTATLALAASLQLASQDGPIPPPSYVLTPRRLGVSFIFPSTSTQQIPLGIDDAGAAVFLIKDQASFQIHRADLRTGRPHGISRVEIDSIGPLESPDLAEGPLALRSNDFVLGAPYWIHRFGLDGRYLEGIQVPVIPTDLHVVDGDNAVLLGPCTQDSAMVHVLNLLTQELKHLTESLDLLRNEALASRFALIHGQTVVLTSADGTRVFLLPLDGRIEGVEIIRPPLRGAYLDGPYARTRVVGVYPAFDNDRLWLLSRLTLREPAGYDEEADVAEQFRMQFDGLVELIHIPSGHTIGVRFFPDFELHSWLKGDVALLKGRNENALEMVQFFSTGSQRKQ